MKENDYEGTLVVIEGADGSGTTTQSKKLAEKLRGEWTSEPTSGSVGEKVEEMIRSEDYSAEAISLVFAADRSLHLEEDVLPKLEKGKTVVTDRYYHSSLVYQPAFGANYEWVKKINENAVKPDLTIIIDVSSEEAMSRINERSKNKIDKDYFEENSQASLSNYSEETEVIFENMDFQSEVITRYRRLSDKLDEEVVLVDGSDSISEVFESIMEVVEVKTNLDIAQ